MALRKTGVRCSRLTRHIISLFPGDIVQALAWPNTPLDHDQLLTACIVHGPTSIGPDHSLMSRAATGKTCIHVPRMRPRWGVSLRMGLWNRPWGHHEEQGKSQYVSNLSSLDDKDHWNVRPVRPGSRSTFVRSLTSTRCWSFNLSFSTCLWVVIIITRYHLDYNVMLNWCLSAWKTLPMRRHNMKTGNFKF